MHIVHIISSLAIGGAELLLYTLVRHLSPPYRHTVIYFHDGPVRQRLKALGIPTYNIHGLYLRYDPLFFSRLLKIVYELQPDLLCSSLWSANFFSAFVSRITGIPLVSILHTVRAHEGPIRNLLDHLCLSKAQAIIAVSAHVAQSLLESGVKIAPSALITIPNGVDLNGIIGTRSITRAEIGLQDTDFIIGSVGRLVPVKNYHLFLQSAALLIRKYPDVKIVIIGSGPEYSKLRQLAHHLAIFEHVQFLRTDQTWGYYPLFDCFVQPSRFEGLSLALLEALCWQLPVIVTGHNKAHELIIHNYNGLVIEPQSVEQLYLALEKLYVHTQESKTLGHNGFQTVKNSHTLTTMLGLYQKVLAHAAQAKTKF
jgi:glycosyltransferase involved in cell wall biosynthesis